MDDQFLGVNGNIADTKERIENISGTVKALSASVTKNQSDISAIRKEIKQAVSKDSLREEIKSVLQETVSKSITEQVEKRIGPEVHKIQSSYSEAVKSGVVGGDVADYSDRYWSARRSLRVWPVPGNNDDDIRVNTGDFIHDKLKVHEDALQKSDVVSVRRVLRGARQSDRRHRRQAHPQQVWEEVLVVFQSVEIRDMVWSHSFNLAGFVDSEGKPTAGVRLEIPDALRNVFRDLQWYGHHLRSLHGPGLKRQVKFNDNLRTLYMDVKLPSDDSWLFVDHQMAKENRKQPKERTTAFSRERLTSSQSSVPSEVEVMEVTPSSTLPASATLQKFTKEKTSRNAWR